MLKGNLSSFSLGEIFQSLAINNHTGTLKITTRDGASKCVYFSRGEISLFSAGSPEALRIGEILIRQKKLSPADLKSALEEQKATGELLGKVLIRKGLIQKDDIRLALETKIREEIYDLFLLSEAEFEFHINHLPEEVFDPLQKNTRIAINTSAVIMEGLRRVDEWLLIQRRLKTFDEIFVPSKSAAGLRGQPGPELLPLLDGATPVSDLFGAYPGSRFECSKSLCELLESGRIRPLSIEEAISGGERSLKAGLLERALRFYRFADQLDPNRPEVLQPLAACLEKLGRQDEERNVQRRAIRTYYERQMPREALAVAEDFLANVSGAEPEIAEIAFRSALELGRAPTARGVGNRILSAALGANDFAKAQEVLEHLCRLSPRDLNLQIELAEVHAKGGDPGRAIACLEEVSRELRSKRKQKDLIKVLMLILELDPQRNEVKQEVQKLLVVQERRDKRKRHRVTIMGMACIVLLAMSLLPLLYEVKARELYSHAQRLEEISLASNNFGMAKAAYEEVLRSYSFSSRAGAAKLALERVSTFERIKLENLEGEHVASEEIQRRKLRALREALPELLKEARRLEETGDIQRAFDIYIRVSTEFAEVPGARNLLFPLLVTSNPRGAAVEASGAQLGVTPLVIHAQKGQEVSLLLSRSGCEAVQEKVQGGEKWHVHFSLNRRPMGELRLSGPIQQPLDARGERIFFPSRDGYLYAVSPGRREVAWQRRVGRFGDLVSDLGVGPQELLLGTVTGEVLAISRDNGKARFRARLGAAVLAPPAFSPDGRWAAAATVDGEVAIFDCSTGEVKGRFQAEDEITAAPAFLGDMLICGSADHRLYELSVPSAAPRGAIELAGGVSSGITPYMDSAVFTTAGGTLHRYSASERRILWSRRLEEEATGPPALNAGHAYVGTTGGQVTAVDLARGEVVWTVKVAGGRLGRLFLWGTRLYVGAESGELTAIATATGQKEWSYKADSAIVAPPLVAFGKLFVPCSSGKILIMEIME